MQSGILRIAFDQ